MTLQEQKVNSFLVQVFNDVLRLEEDAMHRACPTLSVSEVHVLDAVRCGAPSGLGMAETARQLGVTSGTLTVAAKTLVQKGFLQRRRDEHDKRRASLALTPQADAVLAAHDAFHAQLVQAVSSRLNAQEMDTLAETLQYLHRFFTEMPLPENTQ